MARRLIAITALTAGMSIAVTIWMAAPALTKGPSQASISGPGLARAIVVSGGGEPGQQGTLAVLAGQTGLFTALSGPSVGVPVQMPAPLRTPPPKGSLGPRYTIIYTVPGVTPSQASSPGGSARTSTRPRRAGRSSTHPQARGASGSPCRSPDGSGAGVNGGRSAPPGRPGTARQHSQQADGGLRARSRSR